MQPIKKELDEQLLADLYVNQNMKTKEIAELVGVSTATVQRRLKKLGVLRAGNKKPKLNIDQIVQLYINENKTLPEVADELNVCVSTVMQYLDNAGIKKDKQAVRQTYEKTMINKYGVTTPILSDEIKTKIENTNKERYGTAFPLQNEQIHNQTVKTQSNERLANAINRMKNNTKIDFKTIEKLCNLEKVREIINNGIKENADDKDIQKYGYSLILTKEFLQYCYIEQNMSRIEIADLIGCSEMVVRKKLSEYDFYRALDNVQNEQKEL